mgnify:FL=1
MRWLLFLLALMVGVAQSQEAAKSQPKAQKTAQKRTADQRGTESQPLVVKAQEGEKTPERVEQDRHENEEKADRESRLVLWTFALAVLTGVLALIAGGQLVMFWIQLKLMTRATKDAGIAAKAAKDTATATNAQFHLTHRPRLIVRWIYLIDEKTIQYEVTNVGDMGAEIVAIHAEISLGDLPALGPYTDKLGETVPLIHAGASREITRVVMGDNEITEFQMQLGWNKVIAEGPHAADAKKIYFLGYISYKDPSIGIGHRTAFCRLYDYRKRRFMPIADADPDYEHAD